MKTVLIKYVFSEHADAVPVSEDQPMRKRDGKLLFVIHHHKITKSPVLVSGNEPSLRGYPGAEIVALIEPNVLDESHSLLKDYFISDPYDKNCVKYGA